jgi:multiple sugar transport system ATP-binding protein
MAKLDLKGLTKEYGDVVAVDSIDLHVRDEELIVLVGPSGCGKTTTLRLIAGIEDATEGRILIGNRVVNGVAPKDRNVAMVFQNYALYPHLDVYGNLAFGLKMRGLGRVEIDKRIRRAAAVLGIDPLFSHRPAQLSGGQRQRVALGRAIVREPDVFLFDEPLSNLDMKLRMSMRRELVKLHERLRTTMVHVTHDQDEAMMMGHRIVVMKEGSIQQVGPPLEVYDSPANRCVAEFIGNPPMNFIEGRLLRKGGSLHFKLGDTALELPPNRFARYLPYAEKTVLFGIRPEDIAADEPAGRPGVWRPVAATVVMSQPLGAETVVELDCGGTPIVARFDSRDVFHQLRETTVFFNLAKCHLFDPTDERAI